MASLEKLILNQPVRHILIWKDVINNKKVTVHRIELKETLSKNVFDVVYRDVNGNIKIGQGTKTKIFNRLRELTT